MKMKNSLLAIFAKIWPITLYYSTGTLVRFLATLKIHKKSNFDRNQLKLFTSHKTMYMYQKMYENEKFSPSHFLMKFGQLPCTLIQGL